MIRLSFVFCFVMVVCLNWQCTEKPKPLASTPTENNLPELHGVKMDGSPINLREVEGKALLIYFNPDCDHCQREAQQIKINDQLFVNHRLYFISTASADELKKFSEQYQLTAKNYVFVHAEPGDVYNAVGPLPSVPAIFIYDNQRLLKRFDGETSLHLIQEFL